MGVINQSMVDESKKEEIIDDVFNGDSKMTDLEPQLEDQKLADLRAKLAEKNKLEESEKSMPPKIVERKTRSMKLGIVGSGQAGSRLAETFYSLGYDAVVINTAQQDLEHISVPNENKLLLDYGLGGAAKETEIGHEAAQAHKDQITELVHSKLSDCHMAIFCTSLGGGSGAGSAETVIDVLGTLQVPLAVMTVLPMSNEDAQTKSNALQTLSKLAKACQNRQVNNLIVVDNAKIESIYTDVSQLEFFSVSNKAIVEPIDVFNTLSSMPSPVKALDSMEFAKLFTDGEGLTVYGQMSVPNYQEETAIAEAVVNNLNSNLLSSGFNLKQSKYVGVLIVAPKSVWDKVPAASVNYAMAMVNDLCGTPKGVFKGIYTVDSKDDVVKVYSMFSGLGLPEDRVQQLKKETQDHAAVTKSKDETRNLSLKLDTGVEESVSTADKIRQKIANKNSAFGKLTNKTVIDRRK